MEIKQGLYLDHYKRFLVVYSDGLHSRMYLQDAALRARGRATRATLSLGLPAYLKEKSEYLADRNLLNWKKAK